MNSENALSRRHFPFFQKLDMQFDTDKILAEMKVIEELNDGWGDMKHGSPLVNELTAGRERLTQAFQDEDGDYHSYEQIILTDFDDARRGTREMQLAGGAYAQYRQDMSRAANGLDESAYNKPRDFMESAPYISEVLASFGDPITRARFARVKPGFTIKPHIDYDTRYGMRYHIALTTNDECHIGFRRNKKQEFDVRHIPVDGHVYFLNAGFEHYADNLGDTDRIHLVIGVNGQTLMDNYVIR